MRTCNNCQENLITAIGDELDPKMVVIWFQWDIVEEKRNIKGKETSV